MSKNTVPVCLTALLALAIVLLPAADAAAQSQLPIMEDEILATVTMGNEVWAAPAGLAGALEEATGETATIQSMEDLLDVLPEATASNGVRFEGGTPAASVISSLQALGYGTKTDSPPVLAGADGAEVWTD